MKTLLRSALLVVAAATAAAQSPRWSPIDAGDAPSGREGAVSVWTGSELIVWGGFTDVGDHYEPVGDGGRLDPSTGIWRPLPTEGAPGPRAWHSAVWTGKEMIVWGGSTRDDLHSDGAAYDPARDTWRALATKGAPRPRVEHAALWTGTEMLVVAGVQEEMSFTGGGRYDPATDTWRPLASADFLRGSRALGLVWTGKEAVLFGGINGGSTLRQGGRYDPAKDAWTPISLEGAPGKRGYPGIVWTGTHVAVFGGATGVFDGPGAAGGGLYDPTTDAWTALPTDGAPTARVGHATVWSGTELVVWGGGNCKRDDHAPVLGDGARWRPGTATWTRLDADTAPSPRAHVVAHWTGTSLLVWGGIRADVDRDVLPRDGGLLPIR